LQGDGFIGMGEPELNSTAPETVILEDLAPADIIIG
jgi:hypothetical protein